MGRVLSMLLTGGLLYGTILGATEYNEAEIIEIAQDAGIAADALLVEGDAEYGEYLSGECTTCHQASGDNDGIPGIVGWDPVFFKLAMHEYRSKTRDHPVMSMIAGRLDDAEIAALAAYFADIEH